MKTMMWRFGCAGMLCGIVITSTIAQQPLDGTRPADPVAEERRVDLRPKFEKGQQLRYTLEMRNTGTLVQPRGEQGARPHTRSDTDLGLLLRVTEVTAEGDSTIDLTIEKVRLRVETEEIELEYDSAAPAGSQDDLVAMLMQSVVGATMTLTVDRAGNIKRITGGEGLAALGQIGLPGAGGGGLQLLGRIFPVKSGSGYAAVGESWENEDVIDSGLLGRFRMKTQHTLSRMQGRDAIVTLRGRTELDSKSSGPGHVSIKDSAYAGNYVWDTGAGSLKQMNTSMTVHAEVGIGEEKKNLRNESTVRVARER